MLPKMATVFKRGFFVLFFIFFVLTVCFLQKDSFSAGQIHANLKHLKTPKDKSIDFVSTRKHNIGNNVKQSEGHKARVQADYFANEDKQLKNEIENDSGNSGYRGTWDNDNRVNVNDNARDQTSVKTRELFSNKLLKITEHTDRSIFDIMSQPQFQFSSRYKNPCFVGDGSNKNNSIFLDGELHCLPYFYLIGVKKSGTSDLFERISAHPEFQGSFFKEAQWFPRMRLGQQCYAYKKKKLFKEIRMKGIDNRNIKYYISLFDTAAQRIQDCPSRCITAEATPANLHMHTGWELMPGNEGLTEPVYTNFNYIKHITPRSKIIVIFRDPVSRLFSDFMHELRLRQRHYSSEKIGKMFHEQARLLTQAYTSCFFKYSVRRCMYNNTLTDYLLKKKVFLAESFRAGFYAFYMRELLAVFNEKDIFPILMTDYLSNQRETLTNVFRFLEMTTLSRPEMDKILKLKVANKSKTKATIRADTKAMLYNFFTPYNKDMAALMKNRGYMFKES